MALTFYELFMGFRVDSRVSPLFKFSVVCSVVLYVW